MQFRRVDKPIRFPKRCLCCGTQDGPMVEAHVQKFEIYTPRGREFVSGSIYVCLGSDVDGARVGCAQQMARIGGAFARPEVAAMQATIDDQQDLIRELRAELELERAKEPIKVISASEILEELRAG